MTLVGLALLDALLLVSGLGVLWGVGLVRSRRDALRHGGLALVVGWAGVGILESWLLVLGAPVTRLVVVCVCAAVVGAGALVSRRVAPVRLGIVREGGIWRWIAAAGAAVVAVQIAGLLWRAATQGAPLQFDAWAFWLPKARALVAFGGLDTGVGGFTSFVSPGYPPLAPALQATVFAFTGTTRAQPLAFQEWIVAAAFFAALWSLLAVRVRPAFLWPSLALLASLPNVAATIGSSLGDEPLMLLLGLGSVCAALWLLEREPRFAVLAALFLAAAALTKNEGLPPALTIGVALLAMTLRGRGRAWAPAAILVAPLAALVPWWIWIRTHDLNASTDYRLSDLLHPGVLGDRIHRLSYAAHALPAHLFSRQQWLVIVPLMLVAAAVAAPRRPALSLLAVASVGAVVAELLVVYWIGLRPVDWYVRTSVDRVLVSAIVMAGVYVPLLLAEAARAEPPPASTSTT